MVYTVTQCICGRVVLFMTCGLGEVNSQLGCRVQLSSVGGTELTCHKKRIGRKLGPLVLCCLMRCMFSTSAIGALRSSPCILNWYSLAEAVLCPSHELYSCSKGSVEYLFPSCLPPWWSYSSFWGLCFPRGTSHTQGQGVSLIGSVTSRRIPSPYR